jgi:flagellar basal-body rod protein FlgC
MMSFWDVLRVGSSALSAQQLRLDVISNNLANAQTTRTDAGGAYKRQDVVFKTTNQSAGGNPAQQFANQFDGSILKMGSGGVEVGQIVTDNTPGEKVYDPTHPDADKNGYVTYPNVNLVVEMTNMLSATRSYEANLATVDAAKKMALKALDIGR